ncbi:MAG: DUF5615 family PIN-like protein [Acidobacteriota bacterium]|nr:DUF5615 family PIN-like protein [Acidobacteriota bacterium]
MAIRFYLDERISAAVAFGLRRRNIDAVTAAEAGLPGAGDVSRLTFATASARVLVTQDADSGRDNSEIDFDLRSSLTGRSCGQNRVSSILGTPKKGGFVAAAD